MRGTRTRLSMLPSSGSDGEAEITAPHTSCQECLDSRASREPLGWAGSWLHPARRLEFTVLSNPMSSHTGVVAERARGRGAEGEEGTSASSS